MNLDATTQALAGRLWRDYVRAHLPRILAAGICMIAVALTAGAQAKLVEPALDRILVAGDAGLIWVIAAAFLGISGVKGLASYGQTILMQRVALSVVMELQSKMFATVAGADLGYIQGDATGRLISRFISDVNFLRDALVKAVTGFVRDVAVVIVLVALMFYTDWLLAAIAFCAFPLTILPIVYIGRRLRRIAGDTQAEYGNLTARLDDTFKNFRQVKAYGREAHEEGRAREMFRSVFGFLYKAIRVRAISYPIMETLGGFAVAAVLVYGGYQVMNGQTTVGGLMSFLVALVMAYQPLRSLANINASLQEGLAAAQRIFGLLDSRPTIVDRPDARPLAVAGGAIRLQSVRFTYGEAPALHDVTIEVPAGGTAALVGPSGAGKSTIFNLILRFYDPGAGTIEIDGQDIRGVRMDSLRQAVALVSQDSGLFNDSVRANIAYGREGASEAEIEAAAKAAAAHEFIMALPQGYDTVIGERGLKLSGGQRQRLSIARAMVKQAPILLLDEATAALDTESERQVQSALKRLMAGRTTLVIAHRLSTVADADVIYVLDRGRVAESGTHGRLIAQDGLYARLCRLQFSDETPDSAAADALRVQA